MSKKIQAPLNTPRLKLTALCSPQSDRLAYLGNDPLVASHTANIHMGKFGIRLNTVVPRTAF